MLPGHEGGDAAVLAAAAAAALPGEAIIIAAIAAVGVIATAYGPVLLERARRRGQPVTPTPAPAEPTPAPPQPDAFDFLENTVRDLRAQRDAALARCDRLDEELRELRRELAELSRKLREAELHIVRNEASRRGWGP